MQNPEAEEAKLTPEAKYSDPTELCRDPKLSLKEKLIALDRWRASAMDRMSASDDGMPTRGKATEDLELIERIDRAVRSLQAPAEPGPTRSGL